MTRETAIEITSRCMAHVWFHEGLSEEHPPSLESYSLAELVEANRIVGEDRGERDPDGKTRRMMNCADRLIAALYVAYHYRPGSMSNASPITITPTAAVFVFPLSEVLDAAAESAASL